MRVLGIQIANGFSPEARVLAQLLANRSGAYDALVQHHEWTGDATSAEKFRQVSRSDVVSFDTGWRPNPDGRRHTLAKVASHVRFRLVLQTMMKEAQTYSPDVIVSNQQKWDCFAATYIARRLRKPQVILLCFLIGPWLGRSVLHRLTTCDHVVAIDEYARTDALSHGVQTDRVTKVLPPMTPLPGASPGDARGSPGGARRAVQRPTGRDRGPPRSSEGTA